MVESKHDGAAMGRPPAKAAYDGNDTMTLEQAYEMIDGMKWNLDGVKGNLRVVKVNGMTEIEHHATPAGKQSAKYKETKQKLGDDYTTTIQPDSDTMSEIFAKVEQIAAQEPFTTGQILYTDGLNMKCKPVTVKVKFVRYLEKVTDYGQDCVVESDGLRIVSTSSELRLTK